MLQGCPRPPSVTDSTGWLPLSEDEVQSLTGRVSQSAADIRSLRAMFHATVERGIARQTLRQVVAFDRPTRLRVELFATGLNRLAALVIVNDGFINVLDPSERRVYRGPAERELVEELFGFPFTPEELMLWLTGRYLPPQSNERPRGWRDPSTGAAVLSFAADDGRTIRVRLPAPAPAPAQGALPLDALEILQGGKLLLTSTFAGPEEREGGETPSSAGEIRFSLPEEGVDGVLSLRESRINPDLAGPVAARIFTLVMPRNAELIELNRRSAPALLTVPDEEDERGAGNEQ